jgi:hypothetical protein
MTEVNMVPILVVRVSAGIRHNIAPDCQERNHDLAREINVAQAAVILSHR